MERIVRSEWLDELPADDPQAIRSRRDLRRVNAWMSNAVILARALKNALSQTPRRRIVDIGAGDGTFLLSVAQQGFRTDFETGNRSALLVDRQALLQAETQARFEKLNWRVCAMKADVFDFLGSGAEPADAVIANLFLHHLSNEQLTRIFQLASERTPVFVAVEPRRSRLTLQFSRLLRLIGCNSVTRHDAVISVRAGFAGRELSTLWPDRDRWRLTEEPAGWFSQRFVAQRTD
jgi:hypothetical protein